MSAGVLMSSVTFVLIRQTLVTMGTMMSLKAEDDQNIVILFAFYIHYMH